jgi:hypothetical protein
MDGVAQLHPKGYDKRRRKHFEPGKSRRPRPVLIAGPAFEPEEFRRGHDPLAPKGLIYSGDLMSRVAETPPRSNGRAIGALYPPFGR